MRSGDERRKNERQRERLWQTSTEERSRPRQDTVGRRRCLRQTNGISIANDQCPASLIYSMHPPTSPLSRRTLCRSKTCATETRPLRFRR